MTFFARANKYISTGMLLNPAAQFWRYQPSSSTFCPSQESSSSVPRAHGVWTWFLNVCNQARTGSDGHRWRSRRTSLWVPYLLKWSCRMSAFSGWEFERCVCKASTKIRSKARAFEMYYSGVGSAMKLECVTLGSVAASTVLLSRFWMISKKVSDDIEGQTELGPRSDELKSVFAIRWMDSYWPCNMPFKVLTKPC